MNRRPLHPVHAAAVRLLSAMLLGMLPTACDRARPDPPMEAAARFCRLYFEDADPVAARAVAGGEALLELEAEARRIEGLPSPPRPRARCLLAGREVYEDGAVVKFRVEVQGFPLRQDPEGTAAETVPFDLFLRLAASGAETWCVVGFRRG